VAQSFTGLERWRSPYRAVEPVGIDELAAVAEEVYGASDALVVPTGAQPMRVTRSGGTAVLHLALPLLESGDVDLARNGDELVVSVASYRRLLTLPPGLARLRVAGAKVAEGELQVRFEEGRQ
jgi:arsenite-transporting ATPase